MKVMKKDIVPEFTKRLRQRTGNPGINQELCRSAYETLFEILTEQIAAGNELHIRGFGTFYYADTAEHAGRRNLQTGETIVVPAGKKLKFRPGQELKG